MEYRKKKFFKDNYDRKVKMFDTLIGSVTLYSSKIQGWKNKARLYRKKRKYIKQIGLDRRRPNYTFSGRDKDEKIMSRNIEKSYKV